MTAAGGGAQALHINAYRQVVQRADGGAVAVAQVELQVRPVREKGLAVRTCGDGGQTGQAALPRQRLRQQCSPFSPIMESSALALDWWLEVEQEVRRRLAAKKKHKTD